MFNVGLKNRIVEVETQNQVSVLCLIRDAARRNKRVRVSYEKKTTGKIVERNLACYDFKDGFVFAVDDRGTGDLIKRYKLEHIIDVMELTQGFVPVWDVVL